MVSPHPGGPSRRRHIEVLVISLGALIAAPLLEVRPGEKVGGRGVPIFELPPLCGSKALLGIDCPACGLTRSFVHLAHGDIDASIHSHRLGWLFMAVVAFQIPYRIIALRRPGRRILGEVVTYLSAPILIALLFANWILLMVNR